MKVLQVTAANRSYPPDTGGYQRTHGLMNSFVTHGDTVNRYCCSGFLATLYQEGSLIDKEVKIDGGLIEKRRYSFLHDIPKVVGHLGCPAFAWPAVLKTRVGEDILSAAVDADICIADDPHIALFLAENAPIPAVYSSHNIEYQRYLSTTSGRVSEYLGDRLRRVEQEAARQVDLVVCTTESDHDEFATYADASAVIPNGIPAERISDDIEPADRSTYGIPDDAIVGTFLGSDYGPNIEAAEWLADNWTSLGEEYHLLVLGDSGDSIENDCRRVHTTGYVEDLQAALALADVALNPIFSGGGSNIKIVEYFAAGLPVISTPFGSRGFDVTDGEHLLLAEKADFFDAIQRLGTSEELRARLANNGQTIAGNRYTWKSLSDQLRKEFSESLAIPA